MNNELNEQISAFADGELEADPARFLARRVSTDPVLAQTWARYHLIGNCLRGETCPPLRDGFADAIRMALDTPASGAGREATGWASRTLRWAGGAAVAASVAVAALLVIPVGQESTGGTSTPGVLAVNQSEVAPSGLREQDLRPDLSRAAHTVAATRRSQPLMPLWVPNANGQSQLIYLPLQSGQYGAASGKQQLSPLMPEPLQPIQPPLRDAGSR
ncbi:MAG: sigma-E factor negative regulatory protein [Xanthomonadales bacterium]|jgi:negative regulator of sigma E activity|nr:sigma-E factor negative regulatory protein [Xanthomonadales bacterium]